MGLWMFIFNHDKWYEFYEGRCNEKNATEWSHVGYANVPIGLLYFTCGVFFEVSKRKYKKCNQKLSKTAKNLVKSKEFTSKKTKTIKILFKQINLSSLTSHFSSPCSKKSLSNILATKS